MQQRGITLIETVVAATLLTLGLLVALSVLPASSMLTNRGRFRVFALSLAQSLLEDHRQRPWSSITSLPHVETPAAITMEGTGTSFQPRVEVMAVPGYTSDQLRKIRVTVDWTERSGPQRIQHESSMARVPRF